MILADRRAVAGRHVGGGDDVLDTNRNARQRSRPPRDVSWQIFKRLQHGLGGFGFRQAGGGVLVGGGGVFLEQAQQFENPGGGFSEGTGRISHVDASSISSSRRVISIPLLWPRLSHMTTLALAKRRQSPIFICDGRAGKTLPPHWASWHSKEQDCARPLQEAHCPGYFRTSPRV